MKWSEEIALVGLADWLWFTVRLQRNENHPKLDKENYPRTLAGAKKHAKIAARADRICTTLSNAHRAQVLAKLYASKEARAAAKTKKPGQSTAPSVVSYTPVDSIDDGSSKRTRILLVILVLVLIFALIGPPEA